MVTTLAGVVGISGSTNGTGGAAQFFRPQGVAVNAAGNIHYVADTSNSTIRKGVPGAVNDFNGDGKADIIWENTMTRERYLWLMNGTAYGTGLSFGVIPTAWRIAASADFNGDGKADILWTNTATGDGAMWLMNGSTVSGGGFLSTVPVQWSVSGR